MLPVFGGPINELHGAADARNAKNAHQEVRILYADLLKNEWSSTTVRKKLGST